MTQGKDFEAILFHLFRFLLIISRRLIAKVALWRQESDARRMRLHIAFNVRSHFRRSLAVSERPH
jgi:hypothetical protein